MVPVFASNPMGSTWMPAALGPIGSSSFASIPNMLPMFADEVRCGIKRVVSVRECLAVDAGDDSSSQVQIALRVGLEELFSRGIDIHPSAGGGFVV